MADDERSIPPGGREAARAPADGSEDWWGTEGRRLALLREAIKTVLSDRRRARAA